jgi:hypothetical protein
MFLLRLLWLCLSVRFAVTHFGGKSHVRKLMLVLLFSLALALSPKSCKAQHPLLPDLDLTPGVVRTQDAGQICAKSFRTKPYRKTTQAMKRHVCAAYHVKACPKAKKMEIDHLVPLELGGLDDERNLWVQFAPEFHYKDHLENYMKVQVCSGKISLPDAQHELMTDWPASYEKHIGPLPKP